MKIFIVQYINKSEVEIKYNFNEMICQFCKIIRYVIKLQVRFSRRPALSESFKKLRICIVYSQLPSPPHKNVVVTKYFIVAET